MTFVYIIIGIALLVAFIKIKGMMDAKKKAKEEKAKKEQAAKAMEEDKKYIEDLCNGKEMKATLADTTLTFKISNNKLIISPAIDESFYASIEKQAKAKTLNEYIAKISYEWDFGGPKFVHPLADGYTFGSKSIESDKVKTCSITNQIDLGSKEDAIIFTTGYAINSIKENLLNDNNEVRATNTYESLYDYRQNQYNRDLNKSCKVYVVPCIIIKNNEHAYVYPFNDFTIDFSKDQDPFNLPGIEETIYKEYEKEAKELERWLYNLNKAVEKIKK